eukprot:1540250-Rhodomonas_salina.9
MLSTNTTLTCERAQVGRVKASPSDDEDEEEATEEEREEDEEDEDGGGDHGHGGGPDEVSYRPTRCLDCTDMAYAAMRCAVLTQAMLA